MTLAMRSLLFRVRIAMLGCPVCRQHVCHLTFCRYGRRFR
jgi:hypothetical protein